MLIQAERWRLFPERFREDRPRRLLALDGGGIRGLIALGILESLETLVLDRTGQRLCDYFDYIAGTSTGAIIAAGLARGGIDAARCAVGAAPAFGKRSSGVAGGPAFDLRDGGDSDGSGCSGKFFPERSSTQEEASCAGGGGIRGVHMSVNAARRSACATCDARLPGRRPRRRRRR